MFTMLYNLHPNPIMDIMGGWMKRRSKVLQEQQGTPAKRARTASQDLSPIAGEKIVLGRPEQKGTRKKKSAAQSPSRPRDNKRKRSANKVLPSTWIFFRFEF